MSIACKLKEQKHTKTFRTLPIKKNVSSLQQTEPRLNSLLEAKLTIWICIRIYRRIDKTVKMHTAAITVYVLVVFSRFRPIIALLGSLMFCLLTY